MINLTNAVLIDLARKREGPCLSLYQHTHRHHPDNAKDPILFANLVKEIEASLKDSPLAARLLKPFYKIRDDAEFWRHTLDGLVVLSAESESHVFRIPREVPDFAVVADSWHLKPLLRIEQTADRFQVLCLTREWVRLYEGNRDGLDEIDIANDVPTTIDAALGSELTEPYQKVSSYGMGPAGTGSSTMRHGHGGKKEEVEKDTERFFRFIERPITEKYSRPSGLPLILVTLPEYQGKFRSISQNRLLLDGGIPLDPSSLSVVELKEKAWELIQPVLKQNMEDLVAEFNSARSKNLASDQLDEVVSAAFDGRVSTVMVEARKKLPGRLNHHSKKIEHAPDFVSPEFGDILDDILELVIRQSGTARVMPEELMPTDSGIAAIYRY